MHSPWYAKRCPRRGLTIMFALFLLASITLTAQQWQFSITPSDFWGGSAQLGYQGNFILPQNTTIVRGEMMFFFGGQRHYMDDTGAIYGPGDPGYDITQVTSNQILFDSSLYLFQGLGYSARTGNDLFQLFAGIENHLELNRSDATTNLSSTSLPESDQLNDLSVVTGLKFDTVTMNTHSVKSGVQARVMVGFAPDAINTETQYLNYVGELRGYLPIFDIGPEALMNAASAYLAMRAKVRYSNGEYVPLHVYYQDTTHVRGVENERFLYPLVATGTIEIRLHGPSFLFPTLMPAVGWFFDTGYYAHPGISAGFLFSTGLEAYVHLIDGFQPGIRFAIPVGMTERLDDKTVVVTFMVGRHF
jgi:hypothetical protein